jgi:tetratricopeptide (TPR) repeat protein
VGEDEGEEKARLLIVKSFWPYSFRDSSNMGSGVWEAREAGERAAEMAQRLGRPDLASAALDGVASSYVALGLYGPMQSVVERRLELAPSLSDPAEVGDIFAVAAWCAFHVGRYRDAFDFAEQGFRRARDQAAGMALHCLDWRALARCRLGDWDGFFSDAALAEELLGDRRENPPGFASDHLAAAAYVREVRGETDEADRLLRVLAWLERAEERPSPGWAVWRALLLARRGRFEDGRGHLEQAGRLAPYGLGYVLSARCDLVAEQAAWDESPALEDQARRHAEEAGLLALPLHADRLQGRRLLAQGDPGAAIDALDRARVGFEGLEAGWDAACTALWLGQALMVAGRVDEARGALSEGASAFDRLGAVRELDSVRKLLAEAG